MTFLRIILAEAPKIEMEHEEDEYTFSTDGGTLVARDVSSDAFEHWLGEDTLKIARKKFKKLDYALVIEDISVKGDEQQKGIGSALMKAVEDEARKQKYPVILLNASPTGYVKNGKHTSMPLPKLVAFYKKHGYEELHGQGRNVVMYKKLK